MNDGSATPSRTKRIQRALLLSSLLLASVLLGVSRAQITIGGSLAPARTVPGPTHTVTHKMGQVRGSNLYHSFGEFSLGRDESVKFTGPNTITNIVARVTGGHKSSIDGKLRSVPANGLSTTLMSPAPGIGNGPKRK